MPEAFIKTGNNKCRVILDCAEVFTERPKPLDCSFIEATYRQEIAHNFGKFLKKIHVKEFILVMLQVSSLQFYLKWTA